MGAFLTVSGLPFWQKKLKQHKKAKRLPGAFVTVVNRHIHPQIILTILFTITIIIISIIMLWDKPNKLALPLDGNRLWAHFKIVARRDNRCVATTPQMWCKCDPPFLERQSISTCQKRLAASLTCSALRELVTYSVCLNLTTWRTTLWSNIGWGKIVQQFLLLAISWTSRFPSNEGSDWRPVDRSALHASNWINN